MSDETRVPARVEDIDPAWLAGVLERETGIACTIAEITCEPMPVWNVAETARLHVRYATGGEKMPDPLFVKIARDPDPLGDIFPGECAFYRGAERGLPLVPCLAALRDGQSGATCLLLEDMRATHEATTWPLPPTLERCEGAMRAWAAIHVRWAGTRFPAYHAREDTLAGHAAILLPGLLDTLGDRLPRERRILLERVCACIPALKARRQDDGGSLTRIHGDAHFWNVLYPRDPVRHGCVLIDWEDWRVDFAALDLALAMAMHWYPDRRARHEKALLRTYHEAVLEAGGTVAWDDLLADYRLAHLCNAVIPIFQHHAGHVHMSWWSNLERWFLAFDDLGCNGLLD